MLGHELGVKKLKPSQLEPRHQMDEGNLAGISREGEHALAKKGRAEGDAIETADQLAVLPTFDTMGEAALKELAIEGFDWAIDPSVLPIRTVGIGHGALTHDSIEGCIDADLEGLSSYGPRETARDVELVQRKDAALFGIDEEDILIVT